MRGRSGTRYVCPNRYVGLNVRSDAETVAPLTLVRDDAAALALVGVPGNPNTRVRVGRAGARLHAAVRGHGRRSGPRLSLNRTLEGEWARVTLPYPQAAFRVIRDYNASQPLPAAADLAELDASAGDRYWYDTGTGLLHLKLVTRTGRTSTTLLVEPQ